MTSALASDSKGCYRCSDFALKAYGIDKASFSSETNFKRAIETTFERDISFGFMCGYNDKYDCVGIDYLPKELHKTFLKAFNDTYEDKSPAVKSYALSAFNEIVKNSCITYNKTFSKELENYAERTLGKCVERFQNAFFSEDKKDELALFRQMCKNFLDSLGTLADKAILRDNDTSTLYPPNFTAQKQTLVFEANYQFVLSQKTQQIAQEKDEILLRLLNPQDSLDIKA